MVVGITGGIGSGKSFVSHLFLEKPNVKYYHADEEAKKLMNTSESIKSKLVQLFGENAYVSQKLNRAFIANQVFNDKNKLKHLNAIVHPEVHAHFANFITENPHTIIIYENAILFEIGSDVKCDYTILVDASLEDRISRVMKRDTVSREEVLKRIDNQWPVIKKTLLSNYIICNSDRQTTSDQVDKIYNNLTKKL